MALISKVIGKIHRILNKHQKSAAGRVLLCRPRGGLNDNLCQVEMCWRYAERHDRVLVVDGKRSSLYSEFSEFFEPVNSNARVSMNSASIDDFRCEAACVPAEVTGLINTYKSEYFRLQNFGNATHYFQF